eukprot:TRINITY_DN10038_c0_g1_i1.p1 TRINITY_DN10038_c0_g1~~TRINITY_DN10038_c0_g1_i1.p1  ORF type:complete len:374 (+),score=44.24 TRINITY_DN10038_c0_g1_i1:89-1210(+)
MDDASRLVGLPRESRLNSILGNGQPEAPSAHNMVYNPPELQKMDQKPYAPAPIPGSAASDTSWHQRMQKWGNQASRSGEPANPSPPVLDFRQPPPMPVVPPPPAAAPVVAPSASAMPPISSVCTLEEVEQQAYSRLAAANVVSATHQPSPPPQLGFSRGTLPDGLPAWSSNASTAAERPGGYVSTQDWPARMNAQPGSRNSTEASTFAAPVKTLPHTRSYPYGHQRMDEWRFTEGAYNPYGQSYHSTEAETPDAVWEQHEVAIHDRERGPLPIVDPVSGAEIFSGHNLSAAAPPFTGGNQKLVRKPAKAVAIVDPVTETEVDLTESSARPPQPRGTTLSHTAAPFDPRKAREKMVLKIVNPLSGEELAADPSA